MTNFRTIAGATLWIMISTILTAATFEPVEAAPPCAASNMMIAQVCTNLATGAVTIGCKPRLA